MDTILYLELDWDHAAVLNARKKLKQKYPAYVRDDEIIYEFEAMFNCMIDCYAEYTYDDPSYTWDTAEEIAAEDSWMYNMVPFSVKFNSEKDLTLFLLKWS